MGVLLAQIGEFAFVLLSRASNLHVIEVKPYFDSCNFSLLLKFVTLGYNVGENVSPPIGNNSSESRKLYLNRPNKPFK